MFRGSVKGTGYPLHSPVSLSLPSRASLYAITFQLESTRYPKAGVNKFSINLEATSLCARSVRWSKFRTEDPCILGDALQNLAATATWCPGFVHPCIKGLICEELSLIYEALCRSRCPHGLRRRSAVARLLQLWVRIPPGSWKSVCRECCVLSSRSWSLV